MKGNKLWSSPFNISNSVHRTELIQYTWATRSAFAYECPAFSHVIVFNFDKFQANYKHRHTGTQTDKYDLKCSAFTLRTVTKSFILRARK
uniref:Uncharacterized protein n=1 Tax=Hyaloperonospora arabidopsidis (strain Emoy2) TaxID=559515 RepID=M4BCN7_HYAAE